MIDDDDDMIEEFDDDIENFDSFDGEGTTLGELLRNNPIVKFTIFGVVIIAVIFVFMYFRSEEPPPLSSMPETSDISSPPGTEDVSQNIREALEETDQQRLEEAERVGGSALPTLIEPPVGTIALPEEEQEEEDPLQRWRRLQQERIQQETQRTQISGPEGIQDEIPQENIEALAEAMATQMQAILDNSQKDVDVRSVQITSDDYLDQFAPEDIPPEDPNAAPKISEILLPAGEIEYAQLLLEANSDTPGPVLAQISSGPLRGSRVLGSFEVQNELLTLTFKTIVMDGISHDINAVAIDPQTSLPGMASEVDRRYFRRIILPAAAAFIEGAAEAVAASGQTTITVSGTQSTATTDTSNTDTEEEISAGIEEAARELGELLDEEASQTRVLVRLRAGVPIGLLFLEPVLKEE